MRYIKTNTRTILILLAILAVGIFLRTYNFSEWLRFNKDQARDVSLITTITEDNASLPLLGPAASKTNFKLGPAYYYLQYGSAKIFGSNPVSMALPDLIFSILSIVLLYIILRKYFDINASLLMSFLFAVSFFVIRYARFAWNPNSQPFFVMLFLLSFFEIATTQKNKTRIIWSLIAGAAIGIGVQLQTMSLFILPITAVAFFAFLNSKKIFPWKIFLITVAVAVFLNTPQIINEINTRGQNIRDFKSAASVKSEKNKTFFKLITLNAQCQLQANSYILSSFGTENSCDIFRADDNLSKKDAPAKKVMLWIVFYAGSLLTILFSLGGYFLIVYFIRKENDLHKKVYLQLFAIFIGVSFLLFIPVVHELTMRFFITLEIVPFFLLGLWLKFISSRWKNEKFVIISLIILIIILANIFTLKKNADILNGKAQGDDKNIQFMTLSEAKFISGFLKDNLESHAIAHIDGKNMNLESYKKSLEYFSSKNSIITEEYNGKDDMGNEPIFLISSVFPSPDRKLTPKEKEDYQVVTADSYGRLKITKLVPR
jgi:4-amino-4-deoxy-L-arabinose transferase-like glycosyltransferase